ncbi:NACHT domain-containing protein [Streptomyces sp. NPDC060064]|uniref:NACHT domain-containing protein n=1 Tax=Streptomyces sp. NPDC060064 TaxID=3347049 RepID=UPI003692BD9E
MTDENPRDRDLARDELKRRLRDALERKGWSQAALVKQLELLGTPLSKGAVSQALNLAKAAPSLDTLNKIAAALDVQAEDGLALRRLRQRAAHGPDRWEVYLRAARRAALEHPYPGVLPGITPPLASVHLCQRALAHDREPEQYLSELARHDREAWVPGEEILTRESSCWVLAGPGGGKSSLLRMGLAASVDRWLGEGADNTAPVLVPAAELNVRRPFPEVIAESVTAELSAYGLLEVLPADFFGTPPRPGVRWQIMIDGLDEITDSAGRRRVMEGLHNLALGADTSLYQFVVATRPLPTDELVQLGEGMPQYDLQPFAAEQLPAFAEQWFGKLGLPDPHGAAIAFNNTLEDAGLVELARTPLMATMLCQLRATAPEGPLPIGRGEVYERFITLLHDRQHADSGGGITAQTTATLGRYGPAALAKAHHTIDRVETLVAHLAAERYKGNEDAALTIISSHAHAARPDRIPQKAWEAFLDEMLRRSGLLTVHADEITFLHQTLVEHLAARHATSDPEASAHVFHELFEQPWTRHSAPWSRKTWKRPEQEDSYTGFLLDAWQSQGTDIGRPLRRLAVRGGLTACEFIADQKALGTAIPRKVVAAAAATLEAMIRRSNPGDDRRVDAARTLSALGDPRGRDHLADLATGLGVIGPLRVDAARRLAVLGDPRGLDILAVLASGSDLSTGKLDRQRKKVAHMMATYFFDHPQRHNMAATYYGPQVCGLQRVEAAATLGMLGDSRAAGLLSALVTGADIDLLAEHRVIAADFLVNPDSLCVDALVDIATESRHWSKARVDAAKLLLNFDEPRALVILESLATDANVDEGQQWRAAKHLRRHRP